MRQREGDIAPPPPDHSKAKRLDLRLLIHVGFFRQNDLILSEAFCTVYLERHWDCLRNFSMIILIALMCA